MPFVAAFRSRVNVGYSSVCGTAPLSHKTLDRGIHMPDILTRAGTVPWLAAVGKPVALPPGTVRPTLEQWQKFVEIAGREELGLLSTDETFVEQIDWFSEDGPNPNNQIVAYLRDGLAEKLRARRLAISRTVLAGLRDVPVSPWLVVKGTDLRPPLRKAAAHAFRMAAVEEWINQPNFWHQVVSWFEQGLWPLGFEPNGSLVLL